MADDNPVGVFDSGVGGLSVLREIRRRLPYENLIYLADSAHAPYGEKSRDAIIERSRYCSGWLVSRGAKAVVVACNTATAVAIEALRAEFSVPVIAMEPAVKPAVQLSRSGVVGVLATSGTLQSDKFARLQQQHAGPVRVITQACPGLAETIEKGELSSPLLTRLIDRYVGRLLAQGADAIVLGCTHYPLIRAQIACRIPANVQLVDSGAAVAQQTDMQLRAYGLRAHRQAGAALECWSSGDVVALQQVLQILGLPPSVRSLDGACYDFRELSIGGKE